MTHARVAYKLPSNQNHLEQEESATTNNNVIAIIIPVPVLRKLPGLPFLEKLD